MARVNLKVAEKYKVYPENPRATALSKELETKKGRLGTIVGFLLFIVLGAIAGVMVDKGKEVVLTWLLFAGASIILIPVMLEIHRSDNFQSQIDSELGTPLEQRSPLRFPAVSKVCLVILTVLLAVFVWMLISKTSTSLNAYQEAKNLMEEGKYEEARTSFESMGDYKDAKQLAKKAQYLQGKQALDEGRYEEAVKILKGLKDLSAQKAYNDAIKAWCDERDEAIAKADELMIQGEYENAANLYCSVKNYQQYYVEERRQNAWLLAAQSAKEKGDYAHAAELFLNVEGEEGIRGNKEANYLQGVSLMEKGDFAAAAKALKLADDYQDAPALVKEAQYEAGSLLLEAGDGDGAYDFFVRLTGFRNTDELLAENAVLRQAAQNAFTRPGSAILLGHYEQDNNAENGPEKIVWQVWEVLDDAVLLVSDKILDVLPYETNNSGTITWDETTLCAFLNRVFYATAFSDEEKSRIVVNSIQKSDGNASFYVTLPNAADMVENEEKTILLNADISAYAAAKVVDQTQLNQWWCFKKDSVNYFDPIKNHVYFGSRTERKGVRPAILVAVP